MKENPKNELTIDIIAFIMDFGNKNYINLIGQKQFQNIFINLLKSETNAGIENQKKVIYLTQKLAKKFNGNQNLTIFGDNYNLLKSSGIVFPPETFIIKTYDKFVTKNEIINFNNNQNQNEPNNDNEFSLFNNNNEFNQSRENQTNNKNYNNNNNYNNSNNKNNEANNKYFTNRPNDSFNPNINYNNNGNNYNNNNNYNQNNQNNSNYNNNYNQKKIKNPFEENSFNNNNNNYNNYQMNNNQNDGFPMSNNDGFPRNNNYNNNNFNNQNNNNSFPNYNNNNPYNPYELEETNPYANNNYNNYSSNNNSYSNNNSDALMLIDIWKNKIKTYNSYIEEGKFSYHATKLKDGINDILNNLSLIDNKIKQCMERGDDQGRRDLSFIKQDMEQTCFRYQCLKNDKKLEPFKSAFDGNTRRYFFDRENLFKEKKYIPYSHVEKENKVLTGLEKFGHTLKDGAFFVGKKIKNAAVGGYDYVKEKWGEDKDSSKTNYNSNYTSSNSTNYNKNNNFIEVIIIIVVIVITIKIIITIVVIIIILEDLCISLDIIKIMIIAITMKIIIAIIIILIIIIIMETIIIVIITIIQEDF